MATVNFSGTQMPRVPIQVVTVAGEADFSLYCSKISYTSKGTAALFDCPNLVLSSDKRALLTSEIVVYAKNSSEDFGNPIFRGYIDRSSSNLRDGAVTMTASSIYSIFRNRSTSIRETLSYDDTLYKTFADAGYSEFLESNPFVIDAETRLNWTPSAILNYFASNFMEAEFSGKIFFRFDETNIIQAPYETPVFRWNLDSNKRPVLSVSSEFHSSLGPQAFHLNNWGQLIDFICSCMPGCQVYERFTAVGTEIWFAPPFRNGYISATAGSENLDWREVGANITELSLDSNNNETANRFIAIGAPSSFTVTVMSETLDGEGNLTGLVPDWEVFDTKFPAAEALPIGVHGVGAYNYADATWSLMSTLKQSVMQVFENEGLCDPDDGAYRPGYERVGKAWRLPNWFAFCDLENGSDMFSDPTSGYRCNVQVSLEKAVRTSTGDWQYEWLPYTGRLEVDWEKRTFYIADELPKTFALLENIVTGKVQPAPHVYKGYKLCRVAVTFTYSHRKFTPYADTYLESGGVIDPARLTGVTSGQPLLFERLDMKYAQISNIGMPITCEFDERILTTQEDIVAAGTCHKQVAREEPALITYSDFIVSAYKDGQSGIYCFVDSQASSKTYSGTLENAIVLRDDTFQLHRLVWELYSWRGTKARSWKLQFGWFVKSAQRGMMLFLSNVINYVNDWDAISSVEHDLRSGRTVITTTNQPGNEYDILTLKRD